jgi:hypothetical protein
MKTDPHDSATGFMSSESGPNPGLTKREHFAAMAMQGFIASQHTWRNWRWKPCMAAMPPAQAAKLAVEYADALIAELNK